MWSLTGYSLLYHGKCITPMEVIKCYRISLILTCVPATAAVHMDCGSHRRQVDHHRRFLISPKINMPFISNKMNATKLVHVKYDTDLSTVFRFVADGFTTVAGRNVGQASGFSGGIFTFSTWVKTKKLTTKAADKWKRSSSHHSPRQL